MVTALDSKETKEIFKTTSRVAYAEPGYLLFVRERTLVAQKFDVSSMSLQGDPIPIGEGLGAGDLGLASFSVSRNGVLVFRRGELTGTRLLWTDRAGKETPLFDVPPTTATRRFRPTAASSPMTSATREPVNWTSGFATSCETCRHGSRSTPVPSSTGLVA